MLSADFSNILETTLETVSLGNQERVCPQFEKVWILLDFDIIIDRLSDFYRPMENQVVAFQRHKLLHGQDPTDLILSRRKD